MRRSTVPRVQLAVVLLLFGVTALSVSACSPRDTATGVRPTYDPKTGRLRELAVDSNQDGRPDTWSYMDGPRILRIEMDRDGDGTIDRWEHYGADQKLEKVGLSRAKDGRVDAWAYPGPDGSVQRVEVSTGRNNRIDRIEHYENGALVESEQDTDGNGRPDKWERYAGRALVSVAFDTQHRGRPDRRLVYRPDGTLDHIETDAGGTGKFVTIRPAKN